MVSWKDYIDCAVVCWSRRAKGEGEGLTRLQVGVGEVGRVGGHECNGRGGQDRVEYLYSSATGGWGYSKRPDG